MDIAELPLTVSEVVHDYTKLPDDRVQVLYHYTTRNGLEGILAGGGLRANHRSTMNDTGEFKYAKDLIYETLDRIALRRDLPRIAQSLVEFTRRNLDIFLKDTIEVSSAYCACLTFHADDSRHWTKYADDGKGYAIGIDLLRYMYSVTARVENGEPLFLFAPVTYDVRRQRDLATRLVEAGVNDMRYYAETGSYTQTELTQLRNRITLEINAYLLVLVDFLKSPKYADEKEMRLIPDPVSGTFEARGVQHFVRNGTRIPYVFIDLRSPITTRIPLFEIRIGPRASFAEELDYIEDLLDKLNYGRDIHKDRPIITQSSVQVPKGVL